MVITKNDIFNFIKTKSFKGIELGSSKEDIYRILGKPIMSEPQKKSYPETFLFGVIQVYFSNGKVTGLSLDYQQNKHYDTNIVLNDISYFEIEKYMNKNNIFYEEDKLYVENKMLVIEKEKYLGFLDSKLVIISF